MLALEPTAQMSSSTEVNPGIPETAGLGIGQLDLAPFVSQRAVFDWIELINPFPVPTLVPVGSREFNVFPVVVLASLISYLTPTEFDNLVNWGFIRVDPDDPGKFQILRKLHIVYPADVNDPKKLMKGGRLPVVVIVHGQHIWFDGTKHVPSHMGYDYLQTALASYGIVSVSVDTNAANALNSYIEMRAESVLGALDDLRAMDADSTSLFHKRLDFDKVGMMGHSRGGDAVVRAAIMNAARPAPTRYKIKAVCSLAPTDFTGTTKPTKVNTLNSGHTPFYAVMSGALDADVSGTDGALSPTGTGFRHYDRANTQKSMVFLDLCNHNRFNANWKPDDNRLVADQHRLVSEADHQKLANEYVGGLFRWQLLGSPAPKSLFDGTASNSLGAKAAIQWSFWQKVAVLDNFDNPPSGSRTTPVATVEEMALVTVGSMKVEERTNHQTRVLVLPSTSTAVEAYRLALDLPASQQDWSMFDQLTFRVCADADLSESAIPLSKLPEFTLTLTSLGKTVDVTAVSLRTADRPRRPVFHEPELQKYDHTGTLVWALENCTVIRMETLAVNLATVTGVDLNNISAIAVYSPVAFGKHQFFDSFQLIKR
ncbi:MAG: hypothetical protein QOH41_2492 [Blastocatellia bacterium]|jgi:hypothetical protein|nr:hypothetical protein [Blastocatellia bacterium]